VVHLVHALDGDGALLALAGRIGHRGAEEDLVVAVVGRRVGHLGDVQALGQEADAAVDLAQALLAVEVVAVLGAVAVQAAQCTTSTTLGRSTSISSSSSARSRA
jgi:hypothetical protein